LSSCVYNIANYTVRQQFFNGEKISDFFNLQQNVQNSDDYQLLGRSYALPRVQIYSETNSARFKLLKSKKQTKVGLPKYYKNRKTNTTISSYLVIDNSQYSIGKSYVTLPLSRKMRKKYNIFQRSFRIKYNGILKWKGKQQRAQIKFKDNNFYFHQSVKLYDKPIRKSIVKAGLDLGIKKFLAFKMSNNEDCLIGNKRFFRQWEYYGSIISEIQSVLNKQNLKSSSKLKQLYRKRKKWQNNLFNNLVSKMFKIFNRNNVSELVIGDIRNILKSGSNVGKKANRMTHNYWSFDLLCHKIQNKAEEYGIKIFKVPEIDTTYRCPICGNLDYNNVHDRIFYCTDCSYIEHRDIIGSINILSKGMHGPLQSTHQDEIVLLGGGMSNDS